MPDHLDEETGKKFHVFANQFLSLLFLTTSCYD